MKHAVASWRHEGLPSLAVGRRRHGLPNGFRRRGSPLLPSTEAASPDAMKPAVVSQRHEGVPSLAVGRRRHGLPNGFRRRGSSSRGLPSGSSSDGLPSGSRRPTERAMSISTEDSGSFSTDEHVGYAVDGPMFIRRGPRHKGTRGFDKHMIFASDMWLSSHQVEQLIELADFAAVSPIKFYVYRMSASCAKDNGSKMEFGAKYSQDYLEPYPAKPLKVLVECSSPGHTPFEVEMKMGMTRPNAKISTGWANAMGDFKFKEGDIVVFCFTPCWSKDYVLHLELNTLLR